MYTISKEKKKDLATQWKLPDRVFFAAGACHILAYAFLNRHKKSGYSAKWIKPSEGFIGNHIFVSNGQYVFDYHGFSKPKVFFNHLEKRATQKWPGWSYHLKDLPTDILVSEEKSKLFDGLWLREPLQFFKNALPRAEKYLDRFELPGR